MCGHATASSKERHRCSVILCCWESAFSRACICWRRCFGRRGSDHDCERLVSNRVVFRRAPGGHQAARRLHGARLRGREDVSRSGAAARSSACSIAATGIDEKREMDWKEYAISMLLFSAVSMLVALPDRARAGLSGCPGIRSISPTSRPHLAFNTAASFTTNTNWQNYGGESTMSYFTQMAGLAYHNFASAGVGIALAIAVIRGIARKESKTIGNFWVDITRCHAVGPAAGVSGDRAGFRVAGHDSESAGPTTRRSSSIRKPSRRPAPTAKPPPKPSPIR